MKYFYIVLFFLFISTFLSAYELDFTDEEKAFITSSPKIKIASMNTYTPFSFIKNGKKVGFTQDLIDIISNESGLKFDKIGGPWPEVYKLFQDGKVDVITEISYRKSREIFTNFSDPYYEVPIGVFTRKDFGTYRSLDDLNNKKIGVIKNTYITEIFKKEKLDFVEFDNANERFRSLDNGEIDVVLSNALNMHKVEELMLSNIKLAGTFVHPDTKKEDLRFGVRKENPLLSSIINKTLNSISFSVMSKLKENWIFTLDTPKSYHKLTDKEKDWIVRNKVNIGIEEAKPYIYFDKNKNINSGLYFDVLKKVIKNTGLKVNYTNSPWRILLKDFKKEKIDLLPSSFYSKDREKIGYFSDEYYKVRDYIYVSDKNNDIKNFKDLQDKKVAITKDYKTVKKIKNKFPEINILETKGLQDSITKLLNGEVDALVDYHLVVEDYIRDNSIIGLKGISQNDFKAISVHFLSNIKKPVLRSILKKGLSDISREEMGEILKNWVRNPYDDKTKQNQLTTKEIEFVKKHKKIRFGIRTNSPPFSFYDNGKAAGIAVDYIKKSAKKSGLEVEFVYEKMSLLNAYNMIETREKFDTILYAIKNRENEKRFSIGDSYLSYPMIIIKHKDSPYIGSMKDLQNKTIVLEKDFYTNKLIKRDYPNIKIINVPNTSDALEYINDGKADAYVGNLTISNYLSVFGGLDNLKFAGTSGYGNINYHFIAPSEWPELTSILSKGFKQISPVEHSAIQQKWFSLQTIEKTNYILLWQILLGSIFIILWVLWWNRKISIEKNKTSDALSKLKEKEKDLESSNSRLTLALESINMGVWDWDIESDIIIWDDKMFEIYGLEKINPVPYNIYLNVILEEDRENVEALVKQFIDSKSKNSMVFRIMKPDKSIRYIESSSDIICDNSGKVIRVIGLDIDITERKILEERTQRVLLGNNDGIWDLNLIDHSVYFSPEWKEMIGYEDKELANSFEAWETRVHPDDLNQTYIEIEEHLDGNTEYFEGTHRLKHKNGSWVWILSRGKAIYNKEGKAIRMTGTHHDITEEVEHREKEKEYLKKELESKNELLHVKEEFNRFFQLSINLQLISTTKGIIKQLNSASKDIFGYENDELIGRKILELIHPDDVESTLKEMSRLSQGENVYFFENRWKHKYGHYINLIWSATTDSSNNLIYATAQDITSLKRIEKEQKEKDVLLFEQTKLASMGEMIGNIAHQWRQPLSVISIGATGMKTQKQYGLLSDEIFIETCDAINNNAQYLSKTIEDFKNFIKGDRTKKEFNLIDNINSFLHLVEGTIRTHDIQIIKDIQKDIKINGYSNELIQCFINIFNNAKDALIENDNKLIFLTTLIDKENVIIKIKDNGGGINETILRKIFEPYFTTKHQSKGTGLGLHITYKLIVEGMNGTLKAQNIKYKYNNKNYAGAEFIITLSAK
ncbi:transporter substrate-binding domain-containing protein [Poseidonibacter lekithochrous]|uniref:transporter substrate-binding domain-containing protein n=1 Tax=Poseidonibacter TaxID=2321187 RepID=UPI001C08D862|nr:MULTISPECIES: transporter substrate-binding domain-containing protein [Poseidonibacter]MBU3015917.1 transporter substrate-binding domain-containing protein [Poseidonibacter lekithochrous]MDO6829216.1 transporter substrate-binding domain-containing protein [Poseidonibacter sp. 1_MG-2023]